MVKFHRLLLINKNIIAIMTGILFYGTPCTIFVCVNIVCTGNLYCFIGTEHK